MQLEIAILLMLMFYVGSYLIFDRNLIRIVFGFVILSNATNLFILAASGRPDNLAPPIDQDTAIQMIDPLPQALILTAIVIGFGMCAYLITLSYRIYVNHDKTDVVGMLDKEVSEAEKEDCA